MSLDRFARIEHTLPTLIDELADARTPDYLEAAIEQASSRTQRPAWTFPERWLPVELVTSRVPTTRMPWRQIVVLALIALVIAAALAVYIGSQQRKLPPPFGQAGNGSVAFEQGGDIYVADPRTGTSRAVVAGPEQDSGPIYSLDGTHLLFARSAGGDQTKVALFMSRDDGSGLVQVTEPLPYASGWSFAPDGRSIASFATMPDQGKVIVIAPTDGSRAAKIFPVFATNDDGPPQYRPDGSELLFIGSKSQSYRAVYALSTIDGAIRTVVPPFPNLDIHGASWSPDGKHIAYGAYEPAAPMTTARTHVVNVDGTGDITVDIDPRSAADAGTAWSNDSTRLIIGRFYADPSEPARSVVVPIDRSSTGVEI